MANKDFRVKNGVVVGTTIGVNTSSPAVSLHINTADGIQTPVGNTGQRPTGANGVIRYNSDLSSFEGYSNGAWGSIGGAVGGSNTQVQFNDSGASGANNLFTFDKANTVLSVGNSTVNAQINQTSFVTPVDFLNQQSMSFNYTLPSVYNAMIIGPYTINTGYTFTVTTGSRLTVI